jgi:hypothetical protein
MHGDAHTTISEHLTRPAHWLEDGEVEQEASSDEEVADTPQDQEHEALPPWVAQLPNAIALSWEPSQNGGVQNCASTSDGHAAPRRPRRAGRPTSDCRSTRSATRQQCSELSR